MVEIMMANEFKGPIRRGEKLFTVRTGHRDYQPGPATVRYVDDDQDEVQITSVIWNKAGSLDEDYFQTMLRFYKDLKKSDPITTVHFIRQ